MTAYPKFICALLLLLTALLSACSAEEKKPVVTLSHEKILHKGWVDVKGEGFTPRANVSSHLLKPDGKEFPMLPMLSNDRGEITHEIDTLLLAPGIHELWIIDDKTGVSSNVAKFQVMLEPPE
jgi:hypothetical protein